MARLRLLAYNSLLTAACLFAAPGCGGKPAEPPPGATEENAPPAVDLGAPADADSAPGPSPADSGTSPDDNGGSQP